MSYVRPEYHPCCLCGGWTNPDAPPTTAGMVKHPCSDDKLRSAHGWCSNFELALRDARETHFKETEIP